METYNIYRDGEKIASDIEEKQYTDKGYEWNKYKLIDPKAAEDDDEDDKRRDFEINIKLLA